HHLHSFPTRRSSDLTTIRMRISATPIAPRVVRSLKFRKSETCATAPQNTLDTDGPITEALGSFALESRVPSIQVNGWRHTVLVLGPVGPLLNPASLCP